MCRSAFFGTQWNKVKNLFIMNHNVISLTIQWPPIKHSYSHSHLWFLLTWGVVAETWWLSAMEAQWFPASTAYRHLVRRCWFMKTNICRTSFVFQQGSGNRFVTVTCKCFNTDLMYWLALVKWFRLCFFFSILYIKFQILYPQHRFSK